MTRLDEYRKKLNDLPDWRPFLQANSGLPGPRGNLELAQAFAELADLPRIESFLKIPESEAPENSPNVFLVFCAITALGKLAARGEHGQLKRLRSYASDARWRIREAVAIALQYLGEANMERLLEETDNWSRGNWYEQRAVVAALAEPRLLKEPKFARRVLHILGKITEGMAAADSRRDESYRVLRQSLGYAWSVAVVALPGDGKALMSKWCASPDSDVRWIMKENLKKSRLTRLDPKWVKATVQRLEREQ